MSEHSVRYRPLVGTTSLGSSPTRSPAAGIAGAQPLPSKFAPWLVSAGPAQFEAFRLHRRLPDTTVDSTLIVPVLLATPAPYWRTWLSLIVLDLMITDA